MRGSAGPVDQHLLPKHTVSDLRVAPLRLHPVTSCTTQGDSYRGNIGVISDKQITGTTLQETTLNTCLKDPVLGSFP